MSDTPIVLRGEAALDGAAPVPCQVEFGPEGFVVAGGPFRLDPAYRDVTALAVEGPAVRVGFDGGTVLELRRFGASLAALAGGLLEGRTRQALGDRLVAVPDGPLETVEIAAGGREGPAHLVLHPWGAILVPHDLAWPAIGIRRAEIAEVVEETGLGRVTVRTEDGATVDLRRLGAHARRHADAFRGLAAGAAADAAAIVGAALPAAPFGVRQRLGALLRDGRPAARGAIGDAWDEARAAFESTAEFADDLAQVLRRAGADAEAWLAVAPVRPGTPEPKAWFFVALPGGLVAMELVTPGAHATYCFSARGADGAVDLATTVRDVSEALVDMRFLREPIALPEARLAGGGARDYRLAVRALPSLRAARSRFVGRLVHGEAWGRALDDVIAWHRGGGTGEWPGRRAQEALVAEAGGTDETIEDEA